MTENEYPIKINKCPIAEATCAIYFDANQPVEKIYAWFSEKYESEIEKLPIFELPESIRTTQEYKWRPWYKITKANHLIQFGPESVSISCPESYCGWSPYLNDILEALNLVLEKKMAQKFIRLGLRYIDMFESINIFENSTIDVSLNGVSQNNNNIFLNLQKNADPFDSFIKIGNRVEMNSNEGETKKGSVIDIDTCCLRLDDSFEKDPKQYLDKAHEICKKTFFDSLSQDFISSLKPSYA